MKFRYATKEEIPAGLEAFYKQGADGAYYLQCEGAVSQDKLTEFRDNNTKLIKANEELKKKFDGVEVEEYQRLKGIEKELEDGKLKSKDLDKVLETRVAELKKAHEKTVTELTEKQTKAEAELARLKISDAAVAVAIKKGLRGTATDDLISRVTKVFKLKDGKPTAYSDDGEKEVYGAQGEPMGIEEYIDGLVKSAAHLFESSSGTGAQGSGGGGGGGNGNANPFKKETWSATSQSKLVKENPKLAATQAKAAGRPVTWSH